MRIFFQFTLLTCLLAATGCQTMDWKQLSGPHFPWQKAKSNADRAKKGEYAEPARMVAIWSDTVRYSTGGQPTRGFGGRIYFYNDHGQAIPVEGQLAVYVYDDTDEARAADPNRAPDRRYAFTKEQFTEHFSKSDLGASYSVWIPWDAAGGERRMLSILPVFTSVDNRVVIGQQSPNVLPGKAPQVEEIPPGVQQTGVYEGSAVSYQKSLPAQNLNMQTTTINMPRHGAIRAFERPNPMTSSVPNAGIAANGAWQPQQARQPAWEQINQAMMQNGVQPTMQPQQTSRLPATNEHPSQTQPQAGLEPSLQPAQASRPTRFERPRYRALGAPISQLGPDRLPSQPPR
jgi:hypothetical protein